jgi:hypothetical protein
MGGVTIDQDGVEQIFIAHYWRHHAQDHYECSSPEEAQSLLWNGEEYDSLAACCVIYPDGTRRPYDSVEDTLGVPEPSGDHYRPEPAE